MQGPLRNICVRRGVCTYSSGFWSRHQCQLSHHNSCLLDFLEVCPGSRVLSLRTPQQIMLKTCHILTHQILLLELVADAERRRSNFEMTEIEKQSGSIKIKLDISSDAEFEPQ